ncbi:MAG: hypothetical protein M5U26_07905 [Planctomycetota bacterium]|nr:hypothetical protein [Planctomycetota bacterium]
MDVGVAGLRGDLLDRGLRFGGQALRRSADAQPEQVLARRQLEQFAEALSKVVGADVAGGGESLDGPAGVWLVLGPLEDPPEALLEGVARLGVAACLSEAARGLDEAKGERGGALLPGQVGLPAFGLARALDGADGLGGGAPVEQAPAEARPVRGGTRKKNMAMRIPERVRWACRARGGINSASPRRERKARPSPPSTTTSPPSVTSS